MYLLFWFLPDALPDQQNLEQFDVAILSIPGPQSRLSGMSLIFIAVFYQSCLITVI